MRSLNFIMQFFEARNYRVGVQVLFWVCVLGAVNLLFLNTNMPRFFAYRTWLLIASVVFLIVWNVYYLVPRFFQMKKYGAYAVGVLVSIAILFLAISLLENLFPVEPPPERFTPGNLRRNAPSFRRPSLFFNPRHLFTLVNYTAAVMASTVFESVQLHRKQELIAGQVKREKLEAEMKFLKSQINPHFLFNALNNVYTLSLIQSEHTPEVVMKLSEMLRYMLYESSHNRVALSDEITYINNYVAIQNLKDELPLAVQLGIQVDNPQATIAPMILIPFIENAFKHSKIEDTHNGWIKIHLSEQKEEVRFKVTNSVVTIDYTKDPTGGIGLQNVKRRLELEYPEQHHLIIQQGESHFGIDLSISLS